MNGVLGCSVPRRAAEPMLRLVGESGDVAVAAVVADEDDEAAPTVTAVTAAIAAAPCVAADAAACDGDNMVCGVAGGNCGAGDIGKVNIDTGAGATGADLCVYTNNTYINIWVT